MIRFHVRDGFCFEQGREGKIVVVKYTDARCNSAPIFREELPKSTWDSIIAAMLTTLMNEVGDKTLNSEYIINAAKDSVKEIEGVKGSEGKEVKKVEYTYDLGTGEAK